MVRPILALVPKIYKKGKLYSVLPRDGSGDFNTSRNIAALRVNCPQNRLFVRHLPFSTNRFF